MQYDSIKEIHIPREIAEKVLGPWILKVALRNKREEAAKQQEMKLAAGQ